MAQVPSNSLEALDAVMDFLWAWLNGNLALHPVNLANPSFYNSEHSVHLLPPETCQNGSRQSDDVSHS